jgi:hypothetical protein
MISLILALSLSASAEPKMCSVPCKPKPSVTKRAVQKKFVHPPVCCQAAPVTVVVQQSQAQTQTAPQAQWQWKPSWFGIGGRGAVGLYTCSPYVFGLLGLRAKSERLHLGLDLSTNFSYGFGASLLVYPYIGQTTSWHFNAGFMGFAPMTFANGSIPRTWDLTLGTGLEFRLPVHWLSLTADWRYAVANPWALSVAQRSGVNIDTVWGNALLRSQLLFGIMAHTW